MKFINWRWASSQSNSLWDIIKEDQTHFASLSGVMQYAFDWPYVMHHDAKISVYQDKISTFIPNPLWNWGSLQRLIHFGGGTIKVTRPSSLSQAPSHHQYELASLWERIANSFVLNWHLSLGTDGYLFFLLQKHRHWRSASLWRGEGGRGPSRSWWRGGSRRPRRRWCPCPPWCPPPSPPSEVGPE